MCFRAVTVVLFFFSNKMVIVDSDYEGAAIEALGSLFKVTQVFLWLVLTHSFNQPIGDKSLSFCYSPSHQLSYLSFFLFFFLISLFGIF